MCVCVCVCVCVCGGGEESERNEVTIIHTSYLEGQKIYRWN